MRNILKDLLTKEMVERGYKQGIIKLTTYFEFTDNNYRTEDDNVGVICAIGDYWFYFGCEEAGNSTVEEYKKNIPEDIIIEEIYNALLGLGDDWDLNGDECMYYYYYLDERLNSDYTKSWLYDREDECFACPDCGEYALRDWAGASTESNYCPQCGVRLHKWDGKSLVNKES